MTRSHSTIGRLIIDGRTTDHVVWRATSWWGRARGLLGTRSLDRPCGLWLAPCSSVHMIGMRYSIDVVFMCKDGAIVKVVERLAPWNAAACLRAGIALELRVGLADALRLQRGVCVALGPE